MAQDGDFLLRNGVGRNPTRRLLPMTSERLAKIADLILTVGLNEAVIRRYVDHQERVDKRQIQLKLEF